MHRLIIENYKKRKGGYQTLEGELAQQVGKLTIKKEQISIMSIINPARITHASYNKTYKNMNVFPSR